MAETSFDLPKESHARVAADMAMAIPAARMEDHEDGWRTIEVWHSIDPSDWPNRRSGMLSSESPEDAAEWYYDQIEGSTDYEATFIGFGGWSGLVTLEWPEGAGDPREKPVEEPFGEHFEAVIDFDADE